MSSHLNAVSPIDGRYHATGEKLSPYFSEKALIKHRIIVMLEYARFLMGNRVILASGLTTHEYQQIDMIIADFDDVQAQIVQDIEKKGWGAHKATNHDVKACEIYLRARFEDIHLGHLREWIHFGRTSEDVNNIAYAIMLAQSLDNVLCSAVFELSRTIHDLADLYAELPMLARTHGQAATPTTLGKEFAVFASRVEKQRRQLKEQKILIKLNGASGNYAADYAAFPEVDWPAMSESFCDYLNRKMLGNRLKLNMVTTQIEPHDTYAELFAILMRINTILLGFCQDTWRYISDDWLVQKAIDGETGSSAMPHKVNPIDSENAEGNLGLANAMFEFFCRKLPVSRLQRDLSDSTVERNFGVAFVHSLIAYMSIARGLKKISPNKEKIAQALADHPEVITEAYQTILRSIGYPNPYDALKNISRGQKITMEDLHAFVHGLDPLLVSDSVKVRLLAITPKNYIGLAPMLTKLWM
jgi:adenylosuccinate lyase